ncbi:MAG: nuclear transport factor 2 family protein [Tabrizicola sp.]|nr:nuclear transport factor 2 family protein [Tabrizicola sp.]
MSGEAEIAELLHGWAASVRAHDLDGALKDRSADIVMFDVPEPLQARGIDAYRDTWTLYFGDAGSRRFELLETHIAAGNDVAWVHALLRCTTADAPAGRLTMGLRRTGGRWVVEHEHHSFPISLGPPSQDADV